MQESVSDSSNIWTVPALKWGPFKLNTIYWQENPLPSAAWAHKLDHQVIFVLTISIQVFSSKRLSMSPMPSSVKNRSSRLSNLKFVEQCFGLWLGAIWGWTHQAKWICKFARPVFLGIRFSSTTKNVNGWQFDTSLSHGWMDWVTEIPIYWVTGGTLQRQHNKLLSAGSFKLRPL